MPSVVKGTSSKRKRQQEIAQAPRKRARSESSSDSSQISQNSDNGDDAQADILLLENSILESKKNYNSITTLIGHVHKQAHGDESAVAAAVSLCRVFVRLLASGSLTRRKGMSEKDSVVVYWLRDRYAESKDALLAMLEREEWASTALTLSMRLLKAEGQHMTEKEEYSFPTQFLKDIIAKLFEPEVDDLAWEEFGEKFVDEYDDIRFYTFKAIKELVAARLEQGTADTLFDNVFATLSAIDGVPDSNSELQDFYLDPPFKKSHALYSLSQHKKQAQEAWLALVNIGLTKDQRKKVLGVVESVMGPWFAKPELLADFLTDCYNTGGSISLLALSGVFYLIQERNIDYPSFYPKLYSLLDADILHSKHRSRFFRLLDTFLASSHLPAALVASFIKRLARLALNAPPSAIVVIVPWMYNLFKKHPLCTFMLHREMRTPEERQQLESDGLQDPFLPNEVDPMETRAIDSCLWEIAHLQSHYHPNVATIAKILSEQFTKQFYSLEDFLDHSYGSLLDAELAKAVKKAPVIEFPIPKRVFLPQDPEAGEEDSLLVKLWDFQ